MFPLLEVVQACRSLLLPREWDPAKYFSIVEIMYRNTVLKEKML